MGNREGDKKSLKSREEINMVIRVLLQALHYYCCVCVHVCLCVYVHVCMYMSTTTRTYLQRSEAGVRCLP